MRRLAAALLFGLAGAAAGPPPLPIPPIPPAHPPSDQAAPIPNINARGPAAIAEQGTQFSVRQFRVKEFYQGLGYAPGSQFQSSEDRRVIQTPGLSILVPLQ